MPWTTETFPEIPVTPEPPKRGRQKRRWSAPQKILLTLLMLAVVGVFGGYTFLAYTEGKIDRISANELTSLNTAPIAAGDSINFLIVGVDDRSTLPDDWEDNFGDFAGRRTDVMMIAHITDSGIQMLSIPRDWKANIPGNGVNRINAAYVIGGPDLLVETIQSEMAIPVHHYLEIDFAGVGAVVDSLGGVTLDFEYPGRDTKSGFQTEAGRHTLDGEAAVAYARSRHYQELKNGSWKSTSGGDIARTGRQQEILIALFSQATSPSSAFNLPSFLPTFADQITADEGLTLGLMADLGRRALTIDSRSIDARTLPVKNSTGSDGRSYVVPVDETASVIAAFNAGQPLTP
ncbi:MAG: LytR family transcriptional regulator [Armatimonadetes bacterium]|nr:MAG: LytR family transcriptional regulator [Armatimonadota bacterium]